MTSAMDGLAMGRVIGKLFKAPRRIPGYLPVARKLHARSAAIVMYHGVVADALPVFNWCQLAMDQFERQMDFLSQEYHVLPLGELVERLAGDRPLPPRAASITFDDGFRSVSEVAGPILEKYALPYTVFLVTSLVGTSKLAWPDRLYSAIAQTRRHSVETAGMRFAIATPAERHTAYRRLSSYMKQLPVNEMNGLLEELVELLEPPGVPPLLSILNWDEVSAMARSPLARFGSHTHTHPILSQCSPERQQEELRVSRDVLRERLGYADLFAYPNGTREDFSDVTKNLLAELDYKCGLATIPGTVGRGDDVYALRRVNVGADTDFALFQCLMMGW